MRGLKWPIVSTRTVFAQLTFVLPPLPRDTQVDRSKTPWIMVMSHFPVYHSRVEAHLDHSLVHYLGDEITQSSTEASDVDDSGEEHFVPVPAHCQQGGGSAAAGGPECATIGEFQTANRDSLQPILHRYGVDIYNAGHVHDYGTSCTVHCTTDDTITLAAHGSTAAHAY